MSYFAHTCPWCHHRYMQGVVGTTFIGERHTCTADIKCEVVECGERSRWAVRGPEDEGDTLVCEKHMEGRVILQAQPVAA